MTRTCEASVFVPLTLTLSRQGRGDSSGSNRQVPSPLAGEG